MTTPSAVDIALGLPFTIETGFTNLQFVALAADALDSGDISFANMISSTQTDESRHAQQGGPTLEILMQHDPKRAQWMIDKTFWISARLFSILTGPGMDYYTPLEHRKQSYKEFMEEWIVAEFLRLIEDYGLKKPWYWEEFLAGLETWHHSAPGRLVLASNRVDETTGRRVESRARMAAGEVPALGGAMGPHLGHPHSEHQRRQHRRDSARDAALAMQSVPSSNRDHGFPQ